MISSSLAVLTAGVGVDDVLTAAGSSLPPNLPFPCKSSSKASNSSSVISSLSFRDGDGAVEGEDTLSLGFGACDLPGAPEPCNSSSKASNSSSVISSIPPLDEGARESSSMRNSDSSSTSVVSVASVASGTTAALSVPKIFSSGVSGRLSL